MPIDGRTEGTEGNGTKALRSDGYGTHSTHLPKGECAACRPLSSGEKKEDGPKASPRPQFDCRLELPEGSELRPHLSNIVKRLGRGYRITILSIVSANDAARSAIER